MTAIDRLRGLSGDIAIKAPCRVATTANITLNGLQTIDGVTVVAGDRVLVKNQTTGANNGVYVANTSDWERDVDFSGPGDCVQGTLVAVVAGTVSANIIYQLTTASPVIGTTALTFAGEAASATAAATAAAASATTAATSATASATSATAAAASATAAALAARIGPPQGRLTLTSAAPVLTATVSAAATIYYTPYNGNLVPLYDGASAYAMTVFAELSNATAQSSTGKAGPAAVANNSNYDLFVWSDSGTIRLTRGPAWTSDTARGAGAGTTQLTRVLGIYTNTVAITNGPGAGLGTYVGTVRSNGSATIDWINGAVAAGCTAAVCGVWNAFNRVDVRGFLGDSTDTWNYTTATVRPANNSATARVSFVQGLQEDYFGAEYTATFQNGANSSGGAAGIGYDATNAFSGMYSETINPSAAVSGVMPTIGRHVVQALGFHFMSACEWSLASGTTSWFGDNAGGMQTGLNYSGRF